MNILTTFNLRHAIISRSYYAKSVQFNIDPSLAGAPLPGNAREARSHVMTGERSARSPMRQVHRVHYKADCELTPAELRKRIARQTYQTKKQAKRRSPEFFQQAKAQLILWPVKES